MCQPKCHPDVSTLTGSTDDEVIPQTGSGSHSGVSQLYLSIEAADVSFLSYLLGLRYGGD